jgi:hypothetical protein
MVRCELSGRWGVTHVILAHGEIARVKSDSFRIPPIVELVIDAVRILRRLIN